MGKIQKNICDFQNIGKGTRESIIHPDLCPALKKHRIHLAGTSHVTREFSFVRTNPPLMQFLVCFAGEGRVLIGGEWKKCTSGQVYMTPPWKLHAYKATGFWKIGWVIFIPGTPFDHLDQPVLREVNPNPLEHILLGAIEELASSPDIVMMEYWSDLIHRYCHKMFYATHPDRLWKLWEQVRGDLAKDWTLPDLAIRAGMTQENLRLACQRENGCSPMAYLRKMRMHHAMSLIGNGSKVEWAARSVGYENAFAFSVAFKRVTGQSPSRYKIRGIVV